MASGKKNYFRHSFFARNDEFICEMIDKFGLQSYYYYFALIEMCGEQSAEELKKSYKFHQRTLVHSLRLNTRKLNLFLTYLQDKCKISYTYTQNQYEIIFHNLPKYLGKYSTKNESNLVNKRKENKIKEKEIKINKKEICTPDDLVNSWNKIMPPEFDYCRGLYSRDALENFQYTSNFVSNIGEWENIFRKCKETPTLNGNNELKFKASLNWLVNMNKLEPLLNGSYGLQEKTNAQKFLEMGDEL